MVVSMTKSYLETIKPTPGPSTMHLQLAAEPTPAEIVLTSFPSMNPLSAARLISLKCLLSELLMLQAEEQKQLAAKLSDIPIDSLNLFFQQATWGQAITGKLLTAPDAGQQQSALERTHTGMRNRQQQAHHVTDLQTRLTSHAYSDSQWEANDAPSRGITSLPSQPFAIIPSHHNNNVHPTQDFRHASQIARTGNPFGAFQYQPEPQSSSKVLESEQLRGQRLHGHAHDYGRQRVGALSGMVSLHNADRLQMEEVPCDYTEDYGSDALQPAACVAYQQQQQQQQQGINWHNYLPEEEEQRAGNTLTGKQEPWQAHRQQYRLADDHATAEMLPLDGMDIEEDGVPDVVIDDALESEVAEGILKITLYSAPAVKAVGHHV